ncbi:MAG: prephenate dehydrogenase/arogenate dehydrogenase family protein [Deltaproteobacteria bacterium]|nr:prephenate dehydrogenase/arogenate dehydrogenase family protein [Deltaproteobacteria bacterium]
MGTPKQTVAIVGIGLIGGSLARALKRRDATTHIVGVDSSAEHLALATERGFIDEAHAEIRDGVASADVVVVATPPRCVVDIAREALGAARPSAVVTDVASTKRAIVEALDDPRFVGAHPIAGTEKSGPTAALADLFDARVVIITPGPKTSRESVASVERLWKHAGARSVRMDAAHHDRVVAAISHLPHAIAYALTLAVGSLSDSAPNLFGLGAGGFQDTTRIASSNPEMWRDIFLENRDETLRALDVFLASLANLRAAIETRDAVAMERLFERTRTIRRRVLDAP